VTPFPLGVADAEMVKRSLFLNGIRSAKHNTKISCLEANPVYLENAVLNDVHFCVLHSSGRVPKTFRGCRWSPPLKLSRLTARSRCTEDWRWPSTSWTRQSSVSHAMTSSNSSTFV